MSMIAVDAASLVQDLVVGVHDGQATPEGKMLYLSFDVRCAYYGSVGGAKTSNSIHFLFNRPYGSMGFATTHTFAAVHESPFAKLSELGDKWEFLSSHDSCWKDAAQSRLWNLERELYDRVIRMSDLTEDKAPTPKDLHWMTNFQMFNRKFYEWVPAKVIRDPNDPHSYKKLVEFPK